MAIATSLGFPRIGERRALKTALEAFWSGKSSADELLRVGVRLRDVAVPLKLCHCQYLRGLLRPELIRLLPARGSSRNPAYRAPSPVRVRHW